MNKGLIKIIATRLRSTFAEIYANANDFRNYSITSNVCENVRGQDFLKLYRSSTFWFCANKIHCSFPRNLNGFKFEEIVKIYGIHGTVFEGKYFLLLRRSIPNIVFSTKGGRYYDYLAVIYFALAPLKKGGLGIIRKIIDQI